MKNNKIYLAGPWFTSEALATQERVEQVCQQNGWGYFSPRIHGGTLAPGASKDEQRKVFGQNVLGVKYSRLVLANIEGLDTGTVWEIGAAYAYGTPVVLYSDNASRKLNVMLAQGCDGFLAGWDAIEAFLKPKQIEDFSWNVVGTWTKEIF